LRFWEPDAGGGEEGFGGWGNKGWGWESRSRVASGVGWRCSSQMKNATIFHLYITKYYLPMLQCVAKKIDAK
jgi:hypothetical protein